MRRSCSILLFVSLIAAALPAQAQFLKKLEEKLKAAVPGAVPAVGAPLPAVAPKPEPAPEDRELPPPPPKPGNGQSGYLGLEGVSDPAGGMRVNGFKELGNAKTSGLKVGDRIVAIDGMKVTDLDEFGMLIDGKRAGETIALTVSRSEKELEFKVKLVEALAVAEPMEEPGLVLPPEVVVPPGAGDPLRVPRAASTPARSTLGITVITLTEEMRVRLGVPVRRGAAITMVRPASPAALAKIPVNAVVVAIDNAKITSSEELVAIIRSAVPGTEVELTYYVADTLERESVKLAPATVISTLPPGYGSERPLNPGPPGAERPLLSKVAKDEDDLTNPAPAGPTTADIEALEESDSNLQSQLNLLKGHIEELEARVKTLEAATLAQKAKPKPPALEAPAKP